MDDKPSGHNDQREAEAHPPALELTRVAKPGVGAGNRPTLVGLPWGAHPVAAEPTQRVRPQAESFAFTLDGQPVGPQSQVTSILGEDSIRREHTETEVETIDDLASGRTIREFSALISNLDDRLGDNNDTNQIRLLLGELAPHLTLLRPEYVREILEIFPDLKQPDKIIDSLQAQYSQTEEAVPGVTKFRAAIRELGRVIGLIFRTPPTSDAAQGLRELMEGTFEYSFMNFRTSLLRIDNEPPRFTEELRFWLLQLLPGEKASVTKGWRIPPPPEEIDRHLRTKYPEAYHTYVLQIFGERLNGLLVNSTIPDEAKGKDFQRIEGGGFTRELEYLAQIWNGQLPLPKTPAEAITGRVTDRIRSTGAFDV